MPLCKTYIHTVIVDQLLNAEVFFLLCRLRSCRTGWKGSLGRLWVPPCSGVRMASATPPPPPPGFPTLGLPCVACARGLTLFSTPHAVSATGRASLSMHCMQAARLSAWTFPPSSTLVIWLVLSRSPGNLSFSI